MIASGQKMGDLTQRTQRKNTESTEKEHRLKPVLPELEGVAATTPEAAPFEAASTSATVAAKSRALGAARG